MLFRPGFDVRVLKLTGHDRRLEDPGDRSGWCWARRRASRPAPGTGTAFPAALPPPRPSSHSPVSGGSPRHGGTAAGRRQRSCFQGPARQDHSTENRPTASGQPCQRTNRPDRVRYRPRALPHATAPRPAAEFSAPGCATAGRRRGRNFTSTTREHATANPQNHHSAVMPYGPNTHTSSLRVQ